MAHQSGYEDYWNEFEDIKKDDSFTEEEEATKTPDEGEAEITWLRSAGYGHLTSSFEDGRLIDEGLLKSEIESLTRSQAAAVRRRVNTLNATLRRKGFKYKDVRTVFTRPNELPLTPESSASNELQPEPPSPLGSITPTSPQPFLTRSSRKGSRDKLFRRSSGNYSMSGGVDDLTEGVEILNINSRAADNNNRGSYKRCSNDGLPVISDDDVTFHFKSDESLLSPCAKLDVDDEQKVDDKDEMPAFILVKDNLGVTRFGDLGHEDMTRCRSLGLIELTSLFDVYNITFTKRKGKRKVKDGGLFGVSLQSLCEQDNKRNPSAPPTTVPLVFKKIIHCIEKSGLQVEGILRVPGSAVRIKNLRQEIEDKFQSGNFSWDGIRPNDAAALLKQFLRELPNPLLSNDYIEAFLHVEEHIPDTKQKLQAINLLLLLLPDIHRDTLRVLVVFLKKIVLNQEHNKMTLSNVAMIVAPNLFCSGKKQSAAVMEVASAVGMSNIVRMLIKYEEILWVIPSFMITQIRHQYTSEQIRKVKEKSKINLFGKKPDKSELYKKVLENETQEGFIRIQAPSLSKVGATIQLNNDVTAGDIVEKFKPSQVSSEHYSPCDGKFAEENTYLFEVGGNIGERCLDHSANMMSVYNVNPLAEWIVKDRSVVV